MSENEKKTGSSFDKVSGGIKSFKLKEQPEIEINAMHCPYCNTALTLDFHSIAFDYGCYNYECNKCHAQFQYYPKPDKWFGGRH